MRRLIVLTCFICIGQAMARADTAVQVRVENSEFEFGFLYGDFYRVDAPTVQRCTRAMSEPDFLVALHLARVSGTKLAIIVDWRRNGLSWFEITHRCKLDTGVFFVDLPADPGPPYGRAWGHWHKKQKGEMRMADEEIRALVELKALSEHSGKAPGDVLRLRRAGHRPVEIAGFKEKHERESAKASKKQGKPAKAGKGGKPAKGERYSSKRG